jgi:hypothetical protein
LKISPLHVIFRAEAKPLGDWIIFFSSSAVNEDSDWQGRPPHS